MCALCITSDEPGKGSRIFDGKDTRKAALMEEEALREQREGRKTGARGKFFEKGRRKRFTKLRLLGTSLLLFAGNTEKKKNLLAKKIISR